MRLLILTLIALAWVVGCASVDLVAQHSGPAPVCEVHKTEMHPEWIHISTGDSVYMLDYLHTAQKEFPRHSGTILSGERQGLMQPFDRRVRDFVCNDCTAAYQQYWATNKKK